MFGFVLLVCFVLLAFPPSPVFALVSLVVGLSPFRFVLLFCFVLLAFVLYFLLLVLVFLLFLLSGGCMVLMASVWGPWATNEVLLLTLPLLRRAVCACCCCCCCCSGKVPQNRIWPLKSSSKLPPQPQLPSYDAATYSQNILGDPQQKQHCRDAVQP